MFIANPTVTAPTLSPQARRRQAKASCASQRRNAAACLWTAREARSPCCRDLQLSMAVSWLSLVRQDEARESSFPTDRSLGA
jgi:hypothetical protein